MEAQRSKNFLKNYKSTGEHLVNIRGHVRLTLLGLYPGWTNQPVLTLPPSIFGIILDLSSLVLAIIHNPSAVFHTERFVKDLRRDLCKCRSR
jgi:hypothetical protein